MKIKNDMGTSFNQDVTTATALIDTLVKPIMIYASDFWGCLKMPNPNPIENLHMLMCKQILGVQKQTTNIGVLLELGRVPMHIHAAKLSVKNWERIEKGHANPILLGSYKNAKEEKLPWIENIYTILEKNGMANFYRETHDVRHPFIYKKLFQRLSDIFHQNSFEIIKNEKSKLRTYAVFKTQIGFEKYLSEIKNVSVRTQVTKFRLSNHRLNIEVGRYNKNKNQNDRNCIFCPHKIEDEFHFLFECPVYGHQRIILIEPFTRTIPGFTYLPKNVKLQYLLQDIDPRISTYIANCFQIREFLESKPKRRC